MSEVAKGGKGKRAPYTTTHYRIPKPLKPLVSNLAGVFRRHIDDGLEVEEAAKLVSDLFILGNKYNGEAALLPGNKYEQMLVELEVLQARCNELQAQLKGYQLQCIHLESENHQLEERLEQRYSQETVAQLSKKYAKALKDIEYWQEVAESYKRQAVKLNAESEAVRKKEPAQILNELKGRNKRTKATLVDVELIHELLS